MKISYDSRDDEKIHIYRTTALHRAPSPMLASIVIITNTYMYDEQALGLENVVFFFFYSDYVWQSDDVFFGEQQQQNK